MPYYAVAKGSKLVYTAIGVIVKNKSTVIVAHLIRNSVLLLKPMHSCKVGANQDQVHLIVPEVDHQVEFLVLVAHQVVILVVILVVIPVAIPVATLVVAQSVLLPLQHLLLLLLLIVFMLMVLREEMDKPARLHQDMVFIMVLMIQEMLLFLG